VIRDGHDERVAGGRGVVERDGERTGVVGDHTLGLNAPGCVSATGGEGGEGEVAGSGEGAGGVSGIHAEVVGGTGEEVGERDGVRGREGGDERGGGAVGGRGAVIDLSIGEDIGGPGD